MNDIDKFALALHHYNDGNANNWSTEERHEKYLVFQRDIENLQCNDFRWFYYRAHFLSSQEQLEDAKIHIDRAIELISNLSNGIFDTGENCVLMFAPDNNQSGIRFLVELPAIKKQISNVYLCAGEIYAKIGDNINSLKYYQIGHYYGSFLKSEFENNEQVSVFSFRRFNEYSLSDLINNSITVSPSTHMNDPLDSVINLWVDEDRMYTHCKEKRHIKPYSQSFNYYRIRAFCLGFNNKPIKNILMWSHYAGEHTGFCIKYKLSKHFIYQSENATHEHMYLKKIIYTNEKIDITTKSIDSDLAFATKKRDWKYENEVRLIVYNPNKEESFYDIELDDKSEIEAIYFGYRCSPYVIDTIKNIFINRRTSVPKFFKMVLDEKNIYRLRYIRV